MGAVIFRLSDIEFRTRSRPDSCPYCDSRLLQGWGWEDKLIEDFKFDRVMVHRYRCEACGRTFRHYPSGIDQSVLSLRVRQAAAILWGLGLSLHAVVTLMRVLGISMSRSSIWRAGESVDRTLRRRLSKKFFPVVMDSFARIIYAFEDSGHVVVLRFGPEDSIGVGVTYSPISELRALAKALAVDITDRDMNN